MRFFVHMDLPPLSWRGSVGFALGSILSEDEEIVADQDILHDRRQEGRDRC